MRDDLDPALPGIFARILAEADRRRRTTIERQAEQVKAFIAKHPHHAEAAQEAAEQRRRALLKWSRTAKVVPPHNMRRPETDQLPAEPHEY